jgi:4-hydroxybenzoate polyprenyltransferase
MEPMTLVGTVIGVMLNKTLPNWLILAMLILLLAATTYKTAMKGVKVRCVGLVMVVSVGTTDMT